MSGARKIAEVLCADSEANGSSEALPLTDELDVLPEMPAASTALLYIDGEDDFETGRKLDGPKELYEKEVSTTTDKTKEQSNFCASPAVEGIEASDLIKAGH